ncbi:unnamed protein product [Adineta ricciae]|uniref:Calcineurin-like phosphoesterase domain-containing protein n=1 Tax=Adineta ricciae TaxID=249248 RepID=A0A814NSD1_ADIRI|nr:unnamed protein product [Adineta ricciae]
MKLIIFLLNLHIYVVFSSNEYFGNTSKHLFYFVQVTDIHITHFGHEDRMKQFEDFCNQIIKILIKPEVTIVSGDLVNNVGGLKYKHDRLFGTGQYEQEWNIYRNILDRTNVTQYTKWLDIKGNHDTFMDSNPDSPKSFFRVYSHQGHLHGGSYEYTLKTKDNDSYSFIGIDFCPKPGVGRPFNFFGSISNKEMQNLVRLSEQTKNSTSTILFGHYPLSYTYSYGLQQLMSHALVYLNGHLHSGIKQLYARHSTGLLELELGDWKRNRRFRLITIDSGILSFGDFRFNDPIYAIISNPKSARFKTSREPLIRLRESTHIRIVIFSYLPIVDVQISIDEQSMGSARQAIDHSNLFVLPWNASIYHDDNLHVISVRIRDQENNSITITHEFSLTLSTITSWNKSKILLTVHQPTFGLCFLTLSLFIYIALLLFFRYQAKRIPIHFNGRCLLWNRFRLRMTLLCSVDLIYFSLLAFVIYHFIGPWYIGYLTQDHIGAVFLWGILIKRTYLPPDIQVLSGNFQLYFIVFPYTHCLSSLCYYRYKQLESSTNLIKFYFSRCGRIFTIYILFVYTISFLMFWSFVMTASYRFGWILSPFGLILIAFAIFLYLHAHRLKCGDFKLLTSQSSTEIMNSNNSKVQMQIGEQQSVLKSR